MVNVGIYTIHGSYGCYRGYNKTNGHYSWFLNHPSEKYIHKFTSQIPFPPKKSGWKYTIFETTLPDRFPQAIVRASVSKQFKLQYDNKTILINCWKIWRYCKRSIFVEGNLTSILMKKCRHGRSFEEFLFLSGDFTILAFFVASKWLLCTIISKDFPSSCKKNKDASEQPNFEKKKNMQRWNSKPVKMMDIVVFWSASKLVILYQVIEKWPFYPQTLEVTNNLWRDHVNSPSQKGHRRIVRSFWCHQLSIPNWCLKVMGFRGVLVGRIYTPRHPHSCPNYKKQSQTHKLLVGDI